MKTLLEKLALLTPNKARFFFDLFFALFASLFTATVLAQTSSFNKGFLLPLLAAPSVFLGINMVLGLYSWFRISNIFIKGAILWVAVGLASFVIFLVSGSLVAGYLWGTLTILPTFLVRLVLQASRGKPLNSSLSQVIHERGPVLVIGGAGYIGACVVDELLKDKRAVRVLDKLMYGKAPLQSFLARPDFELIEGDCADLGKLTSAMRGASSVVHLAGLVGDPACAVSPEFTRQSNIISTRLAKEIAEGLGIHRFVFASSCSVYGVSDQEVTERDTLNPVSLYAQTKIDSEKELLQSVRDEFIVTILRFATVFGHSARPRFDLVGNLFSAQAWNTGEITVIGPDQWRPFIHVTDLARAIVLVLQSPSRRVQNQIFNVGDERLNLTILDLAKAVQKVCLQIGKNVKINVQTEGTNDRRNYRVSFKKIKTSLKYSAETSVEDGITEILQNFQKGVYKNYQDPSYSNLLTTKTLVNSGWRKSKESLFTSLEENT